MNPASIPMAMNIGPTEILLILLVLVLLFGAKKLPELARGSGRALRIFKAETKGLLDDDEDEDKDKDRPADHRRSDEQRAIDAQQWTPESHTAPHETTEAPQQRPDGPR